MKTITIELTEREAEFLRTCMGQAMERPLFPWESEAANKVHKALTGEDHRSYQPHGTPR